MKYSEAKRMIQEWKACGLRSNRMGLWENEFTLGWRDNEQVYARIVFTKHELMYSILPVRKLVILKRDAVKAQGRNEGIRVTS
jgi:hypothetical protein